MILFGVRGDEPESQRGQSYWYFLTSREDQDNDLWCVLGGSTLIFRLDALHIFSVKIHVEEISGFW